MPRSPSRNDRDRRDRDRDRYRSQKDHSNDVARMKEKMRSNLETARTSSNFQEKSQKSTKIEELTAEEHLARTKAIEAIEEGGFQPASFRSGSAPKKDQKSRKENSHDSAIFGPAWKSAEQRKAIEKKESDVSSIKIPSAPPPPMNSMAPMIPDNMYSSNNEIRQAEWKSYFCQLRNELLSQNY